MDARDAAVLLLVPFAALAFVDGVWIHLWRLRLHARPECRREHALHTARALLFPVVLVLVYAIESAGPLLALALVAVAADTVLEAFDTLEESGSRAALGGLSRAESLLHVVLVSLRAASLALAFAAKPAWAWSASAPVWSEAVPPWQEAFVLQGLLPGAIAVAALHVALAWRAPARGAAART